MSDMRKLMNLMEGVMAVPGMGGVGGSESDMQTAGTVGRNASYAEFDAAQQPASESTGGFDIIEYVKEEYAKHIASGMSDRKAKSSIYHNLKMDEYSLNEINSIFDEAFPANAGGLEEKAPPGMEDVVMQLKKEYPDDHSKAFATAWSIYNKKHGKANESVGDDPILDELKARARKDSENGYVQHVNVDPERGPYISDWFDSDETVASYSGGRPVGVSAGELEEDFDGEDTAENYERHLNALNARLLPMRKAGQRLAADAIYASVYSALNKALPQGQRDYVKALNNRMWAGNQWETDPKSHRSAVNELGLEEAYSTIRGIDAERYQPRPGLEGPFSSKSGKVVYYDPKEGKYYDPDSDFYLDDFSFDESVPAVDSCQQSNPASADEACAMGETSSISPTGEYSSLSSTSSRFNEPTPQQNRIMRGMAKLVYNSGVRDGEVAAETGNFDPNRGLESALHLWHEYQDQHINDGWADLGVSDMLEVEYTRGFDAGSKGLAEAYDMQNGYNDVNVASGKDYFPNGADSPVVTDVGPSGARSGDNPQQKKMQVAETHKELVYAYRKYLKESAPAIKKKLVESKVVDNIKLSELSDNPYADSDSISYDDSIELFADALNKNGQPVNIRYSVDVLAEAEIEWESDDEPTGWNYGTDSPTYTTSSYATSGEISVKNVQFTPGAEYYVGDDAMELQEFQQNFTPDVLKQLLNPAIYAKALAPSFDSSTENLEPPEQDYHEPERDSRY